MIILDKWLTKQFNHKVYFIENINFSDLNLDNVNERSLIYYKSPILDDEKIKILKIEGFKFIEHSILYKLIIKKNYKINNNFREANIEDREELKNMAKNSFINSRFFNDQNIAISIAEKVKVNWIDNYFNGKRGNSLIVAEENSIITRFILLIFKDDRIIIDLIAIKKNYRGMNIASNLIQFTISKFNKYNLILAGTQKIIQPQLDCMKKIILR